MAATNWNEERTKLRERFTAGDITKATRKELEWYLVVLSNARDDSGLIKGVIYTPETEAFAAVVRHLLQIRLGEELHEKSHRISFWAFVVSIAAAVIAAVAAVFSGLQTWGGGQNIHVTVPASVPAMSFQATPLTNSGLVSQPTSTNSEHPN